MSALLQFKPENKVPLFPEILTTFSSIRFLFLWEGSADICTLTDPIYEINIFNKNNKINKNKNKNKNKNIWILDNKNYIVQSNKLTNKKSNMKYNKIWYNIIYKPWIVLDVEGILADDTLLVLSLVKRGL
jgi:hypothetical protein